MCVRVYVHTYILFSFSLPDQNARGETELVFPESESSLPSISMLRVKELAVERKIVDKVMTRPVTEVEAKANALEMIGREDCAIGRSKAS